MTSYHDKTEIDYVAIKKELKQRYKEKFKEKLKNEKMNIEHDYMKQIIIKDKDLLE